MLERLFPNLKIVLRDMGAILILLGILMLSLGIVSCVFKEFYVLKNLLIIAFSTLALGLLLRFAFRKAKETELKHAMICAALAWLVVPALSSLLFVFVEKKNPLSPLDAFFEAMSGWTGTGFTMITHPSSLTYTMQFWRSLMQWVGGVGVIVLMLSILARPGTGAFLLYRAEGREEKIRPSVISTVRIIWWIYLFFTVIGIIIFYIAGMPLWHAINHSMTAIATGGFTLTDNSMAYYNNIHVELAIIPIMIFGAIPFIVHYRIFREERRAFLKDVQCKTLLFLLFSLLVPLTLVNYFFVYGDILSSLHYSSFQLISGLTCTGFQTVNLHLWPGAALNIVMIAMIIGGGAGSTAGGIKLIRLVIAYKGISWMLSKAFLPKRAIKPFRFANRLLEDKEMGTIVGEANLIIILWLIFLFVGVAVLSYVVSPQYHLTEIMFEVASAQSNVGLSTGIVGPQMSYIGKIMLIINMWIGRLEIIPVLMLFRSMVKGFGPL
ncbi:MAG: TrkH family potassium uptake protein [Candidatus Methanospirareceae archaeon]